MKPIRFENRKLWASVGLAFAAAVVAVVFQNCGQAGFDTVGEGSMAAPVNMAYKSAPVPLDFNFNQVAYMSCQKTAGSPPQVAGDNDGLGTPYFTLRGGGYSNANLSSMADAPAGGLSLGKDAVDYIRQTISPTTTPQSLSHFIRTSPHTANRVMTSGMISQNRTPEVIADFAMASSFMDILSTNAMANYVGAQPVNASGATDKINYFSQVAFGKRNFVVSLYAPTSQAVEDVRTKLATNSYWFLGLVDAGRATTAASIVANLSGPDSDVTKRLFAKGYSLTFASVPANSGRHAGITNVQEFNLNPGEGSTAVNLSVQENQLWECLPPITIVRHIDRVYYTPVEAGIRNVNGVQMQIAVTDPVPPALVTVTADGNPVSNVFGALRENIFTAPGQVSVVENQMINKFSPAGLGIPWGVHKACPVQKVSDVLAPDQKDKWAIVRRFLPADLFELNLDANCAVPTVKALQSQTQCYVSGDNYSGAYIQYDFGLRQCGEGFAECPAFVSICYRKR